MKPCPKCGCEYQRFAFSITGTGTLTALACFNKACDYAGPWVGPITFPPNRRDGDRAAREWDAQILRQRLPARLARRLPSPASVALARSADYVKPARDVARLLQADFGGGNELDLEVRAGDRQPVIACRAGRPPHYVKSGALADFT